MVSVELPPGHVKIWTGPRPVVATSRTRNMLLRPAAALATSVCLIWTLWLLALNVAPSAMVNLVMNTASFDDGTFWLLTDPSPVLLALGVLALGGSALGYAIVLVQVFRGACRAKVVHVGQSASATSDTKLRVDSAAAIDRLTSSAAKLAAAIDARSTALRHPLVRPSKWYPSFLFGGANDSCTDCRSQSHRSHRPKRAARAAA